MTYFDLVTKIFDFELINFDLETNILTSINHFLTNFELETNILTFRKPILTSKPKCYLTWPNFWRILTLERKCWPPNQNFDLESTNFDLNKPNFWHILNLIIHFFDTFWTWNQYFDLKKTHVDPKTELLSYLTKLFTYFDQLRH